MANHADQELSDNNAIRHLLSYEPLALLSTILGITGALSIYEWWQKDKLPVFILAVATILFIGAAIYTKRSIRRSILPGSNDVRHFYPFLHQLLPSNHIGLPDASDNRILDRTSEAIALYGIVSENTQKHILLVGKSGAGKSTLLKMYFPSILSGIPMIFVDEYNNFVPDMVSKFLALTFPQSRQPEVHSCVRSFTEIYSEFIAGGAVSSADYAIATERLLQLLPAVASETGWIVVCFDQSERLISHLTELETSREQNRTARLVAAKIFISALRSAPSFATIFSVRSDEAASSMAHLASASTRELGANNPLAVNGVASVGDSVTCVVLHPISFSDGDHVYNHLHSKFQQIDPMIDFNYVAAALGLHSPHRADTFLTQLCGYVVEAFGSKDVDLQNFAHGKGGTADLVIAKFLILLKDNYATVASDKNARKLVDTVLFTIAVENERFGTPLSTLEVCQLAHVPMGQVKRCLQFLAQKGVLLETERQGQLYYRIVHDRIVDHVVRADRLLVRRDHREAITFLVEGYRDKSKMMVPKPVPRLFDYYSSSARVTLPQIAITLMVLFCAIRTLVPEFLFDLMAPINQLVDYVVPGSIQPYGFKWEYYIPIITTQYLWVTFMYRLDRGYFSYVFNDGPFFLRSLARWAAPLGGLFGCLLCFAPALFIVPIIIGGSALALTYWLHARSGRISGIAVDNSLELAGKTASNMLFSCGLTVILYIILVFVTGGEVGWISLAVIWFFSAAFIWYWFMMMGRQGSQEGWSTLLAIHERGRHVVG